MQKELITSNDGSHTLRIPEMNETYHSIHGALNESRHVFIDKGIDQLLGNELNVFEVGFGTGLNAMTTLEWLAEKEVKVNYHSIEAFPVSPELIDSLNYGDLFEFEGAKQLFSVIHDAAWEKEVRITSKFFIKKIQAKLQGVDLEAGFYDCIYFDAFAPNKQEEMWSLDVLKKCYTALKIGGRFVTYCAKGQLKRDLKEIGFEVTMVEGPLGKREMSTAVKV